MKILMVSQYFAPDITAAAFRMSETYQILSDTGHDVRVITAIPHRAIDNATKLNFGDRNISRVGLIKYSGGGKLDYLIHYSSFMVMSIFFGIKIRLVSSWRPDVIWATSPPIFAGLSGRVLKVVYKAPLVLDIRDVWPDSAVAARQLKDGGLLYRIARFIEQYLYDKASALTCVSTEMRKYLIGATYCKPITVAYNGVPLSLIIDGGIRSTEKRIVYAGNLGRVQDLETLVRAISDLFNEKHDIHWKLVLIGDGVCKEDLKKLISDRHLQESITIVKPMGKLEVLRYLSNSGILYLGVLNHPILTKTIPSKVFDYLSVGRPILAAVNGEGKSILMRSQANIIVEPGNSAEIKFALKELIENYSYYLGKSKENIDLVHKYFTREKSVEELVTALQEATN